MKINVDSSSARTASQPPGSSPPPQAGGWRSRRVLVLLGLAMVVLGLKLWQEARQNRPMDVPVPANLARLDPQLSSYISNYVQGVRAGPADPLRHATLGMVYMANTLWPEAWQCFSNVVQRRPDLPLGHLYLALATRELGDLAGARRGFLEITRRFPEFAPGWYRLGESALRLGDAAEALLAFQKLTELLPKEWRGPAGQGEALLRLNQAAEALPWLEKAVALAPGERMAHHLLGTAHRNLGHQEEAERELSLGQNALHYPLPDDWLETVTLHWKSMADQFSLARDFLIGRQPEKAVALLTETLRWHPHDIATLINLATACRAAQQTERSRELIQQVLAAAPDHLEALILAAQDALEEGALTQAEKLVERAVQTSPKAPQSYLARANLLLAQEKAEEALAQYRLAQQLDPRNAAIRLDMGDVLLRLLHQPEAALQEFLAAVQLDRSLVAGYVRLADVQLRLSQTEEARRSIAEIRRLAPGERIIPVLEERLAKLAKP